MLDNEWGMSQVSLRSGPRGGRHGIGARRRSEGPEDRPKGGARLEFAQLPLVPRLPFRGPSSLPNGSGHDHRAPWWFCRSRSRPMDMGAAASRWPRHGDDGTLALRRRDRVRAAAFQSMCHRPRTSVSSASADWATWRCSLRISGAVRFTPSRPATSKEAEARKARGAFRAQYKGSQTRSRRWREAWTLSFPLSMRRWTSRPCWTFSGPKGHLHNVGAVLKPLGSARLQPDRRTEIDWRFAHGQSCRDRRDAGIQRAARHRSDHRNIPDVESERGYRAPSVGQSAVSYCAGERLIRHGSSLHDERLANAGSIPTAP